MSLSPDDMPLDEFFPEDEIREKLIENNNFLQSFKSRIRFKFALSKRQRDDLLEVAGSYNEVHDLMIRLQLHTGMRVGELVNLEIDDLFLNNLDEAYILIQPKYDETLEGKIRRILWKPKTESGVRRIALERDIANRLKRYLGKERRKKGNVFLSAKKTRFHEKSVIRFINKYAKECKTSIGRNIGSHALRRTFASFLINNNIPIGMISRVLGHSSIEMTMKYLFSIENPNDDRQLREVLKKMVD